MKKIRDILTDREKWVIAELRILLLKSDNVRQAE